MITFKLWNTTPRYIPFVAGYPIDHPSALHLDTYSLSFAPTKKENFPGFLLTLEGTVRAPYYLLGRCGYQLMATSQDQNLYSPFAPYNYYNDMTCTWTIAARRGY